MLTLEEYINAESRRLADWIDECIIASEYGEELPAIDKPAFADIGQFNGPTSPSQINQLGLLTMAGAPKGNSNARKENHLITDALRRAVDDGAHS